jgi:hypothetical protein
MEITLTGAENELFDGLVNAGISEEIAIAHLMQNVEFEVYVDDSEEEEIDEEDAEEEETEENDGVTE